MGLRRDKAFRCESLKPFAAPSSGSGDCALFGTPLHAAIQTRLNGAASLGWTQFLVRPARGKSRCACSKQRDTGATSQRRSEIER